MKKAIVLAMLLALTLTLGACKSAEVSNAEQLIAALSGIAEGDESAILAAENAFNALSDKEKEKVEDVQPMIDARASFDTWKANRAKADAAQAVIDKIGTVSLDSGEAISAARAAYDALSAAQKEMVNNLAALTDAEKRLPEMQVEQVCAVIDSIGTVTLSSGEAISAAQQAFDALDFALQSKVGNAGAIDNAKKTLSQLKVKAASDLINAIGEVDLSSEQKIKDAEASVKMLSTDEQAMLTNSSALKDARLQYDTLAAEEAARIAKEEARAIIRVTKVWVSKPDSAGGVELYFNFVNTSDKTIKYINFGVTFYNTVGDVVKCKYENATINYCYKTGPYAPGKGLSGSGWYWGDYYNWDIASVKLVYLDVEYTDGTYVKLTQDQVGYVQY